MLRNESCQAILHAVGLHVEINTHEELGSGDRALHALLMCPNRRRFKEHMDMHVLRNTQAGLAGRTIIIVATFGLCIAGRRCTLAHRAQILNVLGNQRNITSTHLRGKISWLPLLPVRTRTPSCVHRVPCACAE